MIKIERISQMKIIKNGLNKTFTTTCNKCKSDLEYKLNDIKDVTEIKYDYDGKQYSENVKRVICPICEEKLIPNYYEGIFN